MAGVLRTVESARATDTGKGRDQNAEEKELPGGKFCMVGGERIDWYSEPG